MKFVVVRHAPLSVTPYWLSVRCGKIWREIMAHSPKSAKLERWEAVTLVFVTKAEIQKLNKKFRRKDYATDVLSFAPSEPGSLGELVFSPEVLRKQAGEHDLPFDEELTYMIIHGLLHLLGHDHEKTKRDADRMFAIQDAIFEKFQK